MENEGVSTLCIDVPGKSVLPMNETLSIVLLHCPDIKLLMNKEEMSPSLLDFLTIRVPQHLHAQDRLSPSRQILHQKASIGNLLALLSSISESSIGLAEVNVKALSSQLTALVDKKDKNKEQLALLSAYLSVFSMLEGKQRKTFIRCLRFGASGTHILIVLLIRLQTQLCNGECPLAYGCLEAKQPMGDWSPPYRLVSCAVNAVQSCVVNCSKNRRQFIQHGGIPMLLSILEWVPSALVQPILRCICSICEQENVVKMELITWRGVRQQLDMPIDESLFDNHEVKVSTMAEELVLSMNNYRIGCQKNMLHIEEWSPLTGFDDLNLLVYLLLRFLDFGKDFDLDVGDQITMVDIENFPNAKEDEVIRQVRGELRRCGINPIIEDHEKLEKAVQMSKARVDQVTRNKLAIIKKATENDACREAEAYAMAKNPPSDFLLEYRSGSAFVSSLKEIHAHMKSLEESLTSTLRDYHENFRPVAVQITQNAVELRRLQSSIDHLNVKPQMEGVEISAEGLPIRGTPSMVHSQAVEELEALLKLNNSCQHLLRLHNGLEDLGERVIDLLRRCSLRNRGKRLSATMEANIDADSDDEEDDDDLDLEEDYFDEWKCDSSGSCGNIDAEVSAIVASIKEVESQLAVDTFYAKSEVVLFQSFLRTWLDRKRLLREFVDHYWSNMVQLNFNPKDKSIIGKLEILGTTAELQSIISLMSALHEAEKRIRDTGDGIWKLLFVPWMKFVTSERNSTSKHLRFRINESTGKDPQVFWHLELIEVDGKEVDGMTFIFDTCRQLKSTMRDLSTKFFGLSIDGSHRLIDVCVAESKIFDMEMAKGLLEGCFLPNFPDALASTNDDTVQYNEDDFSKVMNGYLSAGKFVSSDLILATNGTISPLVTAAQELGYFQQDSVECLSEFLKNLPHLTVQRQDEVYVQTLMRILKDDANFALLKKVGGSTTKQVGSDDGKENSTSGMTESQLEEVELSKLFRNVHLEFPVCLFSYQQVSKAVVLLLRQVDQIIKDAGICDKDHILIVLRRIPHLIHLYSHCVPTLHAERMKNDLKFVAIYHNDCMYLAHQCLTLGRRKIYPLVESSGSEESDLRTLASISTLQLVSPLRSSATSALLNRLRESKVQLDDLFKSCRGLKNCASEGSEACEKAVLGCISLLLSNFNALNLLPLTVCLRIMGVLSDEFVRLLCNAVVELEDITTVECSTLLRLIDSTLKSVNYSPTYKFIAGVIQGHITQMFERHLDVLYVPSISGSFPENCEKNVTVLLERRIPSWQRLVSIRTILAAASLEEIRFLAIPRTTTATSLRLSTDEICRLVRALFRPSTVRSTLLHDLADGGNGGDGYR
ncbi:unnamed protein product [Hydatigera taeniaeformis]|uniref:Uncharacterized protein n=1 Tax=Hydatigena taeniaeformis TaxID=6205 RepID=A0A3P7FLG0_HYDTA|nr:unnamed protein product [Hydatigera taeniaeformis]